MSISTDSHPLYVTHLNTLKVPSSEPHKLFLTVKFMVYGFGSPGRAKGLALNWTEYFYEYIDGLFEEMGAGKEVVGTSIFLVFLPPAATLFSPGHLVHNRIWL
jgi:hypothetical protein